MVLRCWISGLRLCLPVYSCSWRRDPLSLSFEKIDWQEVISPDSNAYTMCASPAVRRRDRRLASGFNIASILTTYSCRCRGAMSYLTSIRIAFCTCKGSQEPGTRKSLGIPSSGKGITCSVFYGAMDASILNLILSCR